MFTYKKKDYKEIVDQKKQSDLKIQEQREIAEDVIQKAKRCFQTQVFADYVASFIQYENSTLELLKGYPVNDHGYQLVCCKYLTELNILGKLLKDVQRMAKTDEQR